MIKLTELAVKIIKDKFEIAGLPEVAAIRFAVKGGGCAGFEYHTSLEKPGKFELARPDEKFMVDGIRILLDRKSAMFLTGMEVDYYEDDFSGHFVFNNPNSKGGCGCGISFSV